MLPYPSDSLVVTIMTPLRTPFLFFSLGILALVVLIETGSTFILERIGVDTVTATADINAIVADDPELHDAFESADRSEIETLLAEEKPPGRAIAFLALLDGVLLFTIALTTSGVVIPQAIQAQVQGPAAVIFAMFVITTAIALIFVVALPMLLVMVALLGAVPFGTLVYLILYGFFNRAGASAVLILLMTLKFAAGGSLVVAHESFLQRKGLILLFLSSLLGNVIVSFFHALVPRILVNITDHIAAIVVAVFAVCWSIPLLIGGVLGTIKLLQVKK
jgi:hypothetical protein